jgi:hypothetical protein
MKIFSKYLFDKMPDKATRYILTDHCGADIPDFPAQWKRGENTGKFYIGYRPTQNNKAGHRHFSETIELESNRMFTGFNFDTVHTHKAFGDYLTHAVLIEFSTDWKHLKIMFVENGKHEAQANFQKWVCGELSETPKMDTMPIVTGNETQGTKKTPDIG